MALIKGYDVAYHQFSHCIRLFVHHIQLIVVMDVTNVLSALDRVSHSVWEQFDWFLQLYAIKSEVIIL
jgi:hypothetical protein